MYRPTAGQAWSGLVDGPLTAELEVARAVRVVHRLAAQLAMWTAVAAGALLVLRRAGGRRWVAPAIGAGVVVAVGLASFTGYLLPWDQLALWRVRVGSSVAGYRPLFGPDVRFVLLGGVEVSPGTVLGWLAVHSLVLGPLAVVLVAAALRRPR